MGFFRQRWIKAASFWKFYMQIYSALNEVSTAFIGPIVMGYFAAIQANSNEAFQDLANWRSIIEKKCDIVYNSSMWNVVPGKIAWQRYVESFKLFLEVVDNYELHKDDECLDVFENMP